MTLKLLICIAGIACIWALIILAPIVREKLTRDWRRCSWCSLWFHRRTREMAFEPPLMPAETQWSICPDCEARESTANSKPTQPPKG
jgi:hypothetical protein